MFLQQSVAATSKGSALPTIGAERRLSNQGTVIVPCELNFYEQFQSRSPEPRDRRK